MTTPTPAKTGGEGRNDTRPGTGTAEERVRFERTGRSPDPTPPASEQREPTYPKEETRRKGNTK